MTTTWQERLDAAARSASCQIIGALGDAAPYLAPFVPIGGPVLKGAVLAGSIANWAMRDGCPWDPDKPSEFPVTGGNVTGCKQATKPGFMLYQNLPRNNYKWPVLGPALSIGGITPTSCDPDNETSDGYATYADITWVDLDGTQQTTNTILYGPQCNSYWPLVTELEDGATCEEEFEDEPTLDPKDIPTYTYTDESTGCTLVVETLGFATGPGNLIDPVYRITPASEDTRENAGEIIGNCNFSPTIYYQPGGGGGCGGGCPPYPPLPDPGPGDDGGENYWQDLINDFVGGLFSNIVANELLNALSPPYPGTTYRVQSACELNANGEPIDKAVEISIPAMKGLDAALERLDAIAELLQPLKDFRQPVCYVKPGEGDARTISFRSVEKSPNGNDCLRKRFRYRSKSGKDLGQVIDHWKDFTFNAGSVVVGHSGSPLGPLKVWAASADEGKRVIQHAGREAGVDPNQAGQWRIGSSDNTRTGMPGVMKVDTRGGFWWITDRDGASKRPIVGELNISDT